MKKVINQASNHSTWIRKHCYRYILYAYTMSKVVMCHITTKGKIPTHSLQKIKLGKIYPKVWIPISSHEWSIFNQHVNDSLYEFPVENIQSQVTLLSFSIPSSDLLYLIIFIKLSTYFANLGNGTTFI